MAEKGGSFLDGEGGRMLDGVEKGGKRILDGEEGGKRILDGEEGGSFLAKLKW